MKTTRITEEQGIEAVREAIATFSQTPQFYYAVDEFATESFREELMNGPNRRMLDRCLEKFISEFDAYVRARKMQ